MNRRLLEITYPRLCTLLLTELYEVIYLQTDVAKQGVSSNTTQNDFNFSTVNSYIKSLSLKRLQRRAFGIVYESAIALNLASVLRRNSLEIAYQILAKFHRRNVNFCQEDMTTTERILSNFTGKVFSSGLLQFELGDRGLSIWLQCLVKPSLQSQFEKMPASISALEDKRGLFGCQHIHARCCSLLRFAHGSSITLNHPDNTLNDPWMILAPDPIPWLTAQGNFSLTHLTERMLMSQIVTIVDNFSDLMANPQSCLASAISLSQSFQDFHQACQIFGATSATQLAIAQARLGLVMATQRLLSQLLEVGLTECAPSEL